MRSPQHQEIFSKLERIRTCAILTTGRTGTDLLQSLMDSHPEILILPGSLFYHDFWKKSMCVNTDSFQIEDFLDEFIGKHIEKFKSKYDYQERRDTLGENYDKSINIDLQAFKTHVIHLLKNKPVNSKNSMIAIYTAYAMCLNQDISKKKLLIHHLHHFEKLPDFLKDFPESQLICMTRDPRSNFVSGIEHWWKYNPNTKQGSHLYFYIKRIFIDATTLEQYPNDYRVIRIEDLGNEVVLNQMCKWLEIKYDKCLKKTTWTGLSWHGDRLSSRKNKSIGFSTEMLNNKWETSLTFKDKYILNYVMYFRLKYYNYSYRRITPIDSLIVPFLILLPLRYERSLFSFSYIRDCFRKNEYIKLVKNIIFYIRRICLFYKFYFTTTIRRQFSQPFVSEKLIVKD